MDLHDLINEISACENKVRNGKTIAARLGNRRIVKYGRKMSSYEYEAIMLAKRTTSIPVPNAIAYYFDNHIGYLLMEEIEGETLEDYCKHASDEQMKAISTQISAYVHEMRKITSDKFCGIDGKPYSTIFFEGAEPELFDSMKAFNQSWLNRFCNIEHEAYAAAASTCLNNEGKPVLTHGDLTPTNIIVKDSKVVGIIDWANSGYYPEMWESFIMMLDNSSDRRISKYMMDFCDMHLQESVAFRWMICSLIQ